MQIANRPTAHIDRPILYFRLSLLSVALLGLVSTGRQLRVSPLFFREKIDDLTIFSYHRLSVCLSVC